jgi:hypothetical protein
MTQFSPDMIFINFFRVWFLTMFPDMTPDIVSEHDPSKYEPQIVPRFDPQNFLWIWSPLYSFVCVILYIAGGHHTTYEKPSHLPLNWIRTPSLFLWTFFRHSWKITFRLLFFRKNISSESKMLTFREMVTVFSTLMLRDSFPRPCPCCCSPGYFAWLWSLVVVLLFYLFWSYPEVKFYFLLSHTSKNA